MNIKNNQDLIDRVNSGDFRPAGLGSAGYLPDVFAKMIERIDAHGYSADEIADDARFDHTGALHCRRFIMSDSGKRVLNDGEYDSEELVLR